MSASNVGLILGIIIFILLEWFVGLWLWQTIAVAILGFPFLNAWQFFGLYILCRIFFGSGIRVKTTNSGGND